MKRLRRFAILLAMFLPALALGREKDKKPQEPFYRKYLVAGNALDDRILEQEKRVAANPDSADLRNDFGNLLAARRFPREAREQYEMAMKLDAHHFLAPYNLGLLYESLGETGKAISAYKKSVDRNRGFPQSRFRLARLYEKRGWSEKAIEQYARALQIEPEMRDPRRNPLVVDTRLLDRVSLENYPRDMAVAAMRTEAAYTDASLTKRLPIDRTLSSEDVKPVAPAPAGGPTVGPTPVQVIAPSSPPRREPVRPGAVRPVPATAPEPTPDIVVLEPAEAPTPPPLPTPDASGRPPYVGGPVRPVAPTPTPTPE